MVVDGVANADDEAANQCGIDSECGCQRNTKLSLDIGDELPLLLLRQADGRREHGFSATGELEGEVAGSISDLRHDAQPTVAGQHPQGVGCGGLHPSGRDAVDQGLLLLQRHTRRIKDPLSVWNLWQHLGGKHVQFVEHVVAAALAVGSLKICLSVDVCELLG